MKTIKLMVIFFLLGCYSSVFAGEEIKITIGEWSPFISKELPHYGIVPHIISEIFNEAGVNVQYGFFPWARSSYLGGKKENGMLQQYGAKPKKGKRTCISQILSIPERLFYSTIKTIQ